MQIWNGQSFRSKNSTVYYPPEFHQTQRSWDASPLRLGMLVPCFLPSVSWESDVFSCGSYSCAAVLWDQQYWRLKVMRTLGATKGGHLSTAATHLLLKWAAKVYSCCNTRRQTLRFWKLQCRFQLFFSADTFCMPLVLFPDNCCTFADSPFNMLGYFTTAAWL